jgi:AbrB family looped-hinge helix DNA binding protein
MPTKSQKAMTMKIFPKGQVVIPVELRRKYHLEIGDHISFVSTDHGILLKPSRKKHGKTSLTDQLFGVFKQHAEFKPSITKKDIDCSFPDCFCSKKLL